MLIVTCLAASASAFDGRRKGLVLGGGFGVTPVANWSLGSTSESKFGFGGHLFEGYAWDEFNLIALEINWTAYSAESSDGINMQGFAGLTWRHYFGPKGKSTFSVAGLGTYLAKNRMSDNIQPGPGMLAGFGYEFATHWQVGGYVSAGKTGSWIGVRMDHLTISALLTSVAF